MDTHCITVMHEFITFISPVWYVLLPFALAGALWTRYRPIHHAIGRELVTPAAAFRMQLALAGCAAFILVTFLNLIYETYLLLSISGIILVVLLAFLLRDASNGLYPGLHGFCRPLPTDGLLAIEHDFMRREVRARTRWWLWRAGPVLPAMILSVLGAMGDLERWYLWIVIIVAASSPHLLIAHHGSWVGFLALLIVPGMLAWQSLNLRTQLPAGTWVTPWTAARCSAQITLAENGTARCVHRPSQVEYHFDLTSGRVLESHEAHNSSQLVMVRVFTDLHFG